MKKEIVYSTIKGWINSCRTLEQVAVSHAAVIELYDKPYGLAGSDSSKELHKLCIIKSKEIKSTNYTDCDSALEEIDELNPFNPNVSGKDYPNGVIIEKE